LTLFLSQICGHAVLYRRGNQAKKSQQKYQMYKASGKLYKKKINHLLGSCVHEPRMTL